MIAEGGDQAVRDLLREWARLDPRTALRLLREVSGLSGAQIAGYQNVVLTGWLEYEPREALAWAVESLPNLDGFVDAADLVRIRAGRIGAMVAVLVEGKQFEIAGEFLVETSDWQKGQSPAGGLARAWAAHDSKAAMNWVASLPGEPIPKSNAIVGIFRVIAAEEPDLVRSSADAYVARSDGDYMTGEAMVNGVSLGFAARKDREPALAWLLQVDNSKAHYDFPIINYFQNGAWGRQPYFSNETEMEIIAKISSPEGRFVAARGYVGGELLPQQSIKAVAAYYTETAKDRALSDIIAKWARRDAAGALGYLDSTSILTPDVRERLKGEVRLLTTP